MYDSVERRVSLESRVTKLETDCEYIRRDIIDTKLLVANMDAAIDRMTQEIITFRAAFTTGFKIMSIIGGVIVICIGGLFTVGYIQLPRVQDNIITPSPSSVLPRK